MDTKSLLHSNRDEVKKDVLDEMGKSETDLQMDIKFLKNWFVYQTHLPEIPDDNILEVFLVVNKFNLEKCKKKLEMYFTIRKEIPELYTDKNPKLPHMNEIADAVYCIPLPKLTPSLSRITVMKLKNQDPESFNALNYFAHTYNVLEIRIREDMILSDTIVYDMEGLKLGHLLKLGPGTIRKSATVLEKVFSSRIEGIHYINSPSSMQILIKLAKTMLKEKIRKRVHVHENLESFYKHLPVQILPQDYGGDIPSLSELHDLWKMKFRENQELFDNLEKLTVKKDIAAYPNTSGNITTPSPNNSTDFRKFSLEID